MTQGRLVAVFLLGSAPLFPSDIWEIGGAAGYGIYRNGTVDAPAGKATAGIRNRFVAGAVFGQDMYDHLSGEVRYTYHDGDPFLSAGSVKTNVQGQSHSIHYDLLFHLRPREARLRPYFVAGAGAKQYRVTGPEKPSQPLGNIALLTSTNEFKALFTAGLGVKYRIAAHVLVRFDFRDYITPFPTKIIAPVPFATASGLFHQFTPLGGLSYTF